MGSQSDGDGDGESSDKKRKYARISERDERNNDKYKIYFKRNYTRLFLENVTYSDYTVYVTSTDDEKLGNKNPIKLTQLFTENVKGITSVFRINSHKIAVTFQKAAAANCFLKYDSFLTKYKYKAFIPAHLVEKVGLIKFVPTDMSNEYIYQNITSDADIISVKRFMKKDENKKLTPMTTIAITFSSTTLPKYVFLNLFRYQVFTYIPPIIQCFKCFKFNHSAKVCRGTQMCSSCAGSHLYKECTMDTMCCINCGGAHLAISRDCPIKLKKLEEKRTLILNQNRTFASIIKTL
ncbi:uncharacterized protein LOC126976562 [Leptidea sinapis]|uniref:uncharacterized protein LOC126976562 n=1 Tax=Leptidea sinapis TaxID=189913 RepID=UPI0021C4577C|nr:uncharacterized protein LOC126976562 [Leptidea sinapis]